MHSLCSHTRTQFTTHIHLHPVRDILLLGKQARTRRFHLLELPPELPCSFQDCFAGLCFYETFRSFGEEFEEHNAEELLNIVDLLFHLAAVLHLQRCNILST